MVVARSRSYDLPFFLFGLCPAGQTTGAAARASSEPVPGCKAAPPNKLRFSSVVSSGGGGMEDWMGTKAGSEAIVVVVPTIV